MSHSDSEISKRRNVIGKKLHMDFKPKNLRRIPIIQEKLKQLRQASILTAAARNDSQSIERLLCLGASPNSSDKDGRSALHIAASKGYKDTVKMLLDYGADPNQCDKLCNTPLHLAACTHNLSIISMLLKAGADVTKLDLYGKNPLQLAQSKLQLLQRSWREGSIETIQVRAELQLIVDILISVLQQTHERNVDDLQLMKLSLNESPNVDDQMFKLLTELSGIKLG